MSQLTAALRKDGHFLGGLLTIINIKLLDCSKQGRGIQKMCLLQTFLKQNASVKMVAIPPNLLAIWAENSK